MKRVVALFVVFLCIFISCAFAEEENTLNGIAGSNVYEVLNALEEFGIPTPEAEKTDYGFTWESEKVSVKGTRSNYVLNAKDNGEIINGSFHMDNADNGLFNLVAAIAYSASDSKTAASFIKSNLKKDASRMIGDAKFTLSPLTSISMSSITIGSRTYSDTSKSTEYVLKIEYVDRSAIKAIARITKGVNIRAEDNADSKKLGTASAGDELVVIQEFYNPKWHQIEYNGQIAYVSASYCEIITLE